MKSLLIGVGMPWRGDGEQGMQWSVLKRLLNQGLSLPHPFAPQTSAQKAEEVSLSLLGKNKRLTI
jgi:hypothetical protein